MYHQEVGSQRGVLRGDFLHLCTKMEKQPGFLFVRSAQQNGTREARLVSVAILVPPHSLRCWCLPVLSSSPRAAREQTGWEAWHIFQMPLLSSGGGKLLTAAVMLCKQVGTHFFNLESCGWKYANLSKDLVGNTSKIFFFFSQNAQAFSESSALLE